MTETRSGDVARLAELERTLGLAELDLAVSATLKPGTLAMPTGRALPPGATALGLPRVELGGTAAATPELEMQSLLGEGGMGAVWLARQRSLGRDVAVKRLRATPPAADEVSALLAEARVTGRLAHPGVVPVHALVVDEAGAPLLVMKPIEGASLDKLSRDETHPAWAELERRYGDRLTAYVEILMRVADALHFAHSRGVVHRDVKPENVMVGAYGEVYLVDWGIALARDVEGAARGIVGTPVFMAPEMVDEDPSRVDARTDVYLLGATLHTLLTRTPRHTGRTLPEVLLGAITSEPIAYEPDVPAELGRLANQATARDPSERPASALAFREALAAFLRHRASTRIAEAAAKALATAQGDALAEARFGFAQALREWPENEEARAGLRRALVLSVEAELARRSPVAAAELARQIEPRDAELDARIGALEAELAENEKLAAQAQADARDRDPRVARRERRLLLAVVLAVVVIVGAASAVTLAGGGVLPSMDVVLGSDLASVSVIGLTIGAFYRRLTPNRWSRNATGFVLLGVSLRLVTDFVAWVRDDPTSTMAPYGILVLVGGIAGGAFALTPRLFAAAGVGAVGALVTALWPPAALPAMLATVAVATVVLVLRGEE